jgi:hypothetical protein
MNKHSNILKIPVFSDLYKDFMNKIAQKMNNFDKKADVPIYNTDRKLDDTMMNIVEAPSSFLVSPILPDGHTYQTKTLLELTDKDERFLMKLSILDISPNVTYDFVQVFCPKCLTSCSTKDYSNEEIMKAEKFYCKFCKNKSAECKIYFNAGMICRENAYSNKLIRIYLSTYDNEGVKIFYNI